MILGLLDTDWKTVRYDSLPEDLKKSFSEDCYRQALEFYEKNSSLCDSLTKAGRKLRTYVPELSEIKSIQLFLGTCWIDGIEDRSNYWIQVDPATVEQFIGLTDKYTKKMIFCLRGWDL